MHAFIDIDSPALIEALSRQGIVEPTPAQTQTIEAVLDGYDTLVSAPTGSGKTLAFLLPVLQSLQASRTRHKSIRALVLSPTRELARQIVGEARKLCDREAVNVVALTGGDHRATQQNYVKDADLLVATPGRLGDLVGDSLIDLSHIQFLVVDEADRTLDMGFADVVTQIAVACNPERQTLLFSATLEGPGVRDFSEALTDPANREEIHIAAEQESRIHQKILVDDPDHVARLIPELFLQQAFTRAIVFANKRESVERLYAALVESGEPALALHGEMDAGKRKRIHSEFVAGRSRVLVATDLAARGLDIAEVDLVVNAELPFNVPGFIHRAGRTGRMGKAGRVISLVSAHTWSRMAAIERYLGIDVAPLIILGAEANFKGPKKLKSSGKAAGGKKPTGKKKKQDAGKRDEAKSKPKKRLRDRKNIGKRRKPARREDD